MYNMYAMHVEDFDLAQVRLLAALAASLNLTAAAKHVGLSQSAASHAIARLRTAVDDPLFVRAAGGIRLTPFGERLGAAAQRAMEALHVGFAVNPSFDPQTTTRAFNLYLSEIGQIIFLPRLLEFMSREAPGASLRARPIPLDRPDLAMASSDIDLAVGFFTNLTSGFHQSFLFRERYVCVVRANHPDFRDGMRLEAFVAAQHALADSSGMAHELIERTLAKHKIRRNVKIRVPEFLVLPLVISSSDLLVIMPNRIAEEFSKLMPIKILPLPVPIPAYDIRLFWHDRHHNDPANRWLRRSLIKLFRRQGESNRVAERRAFR
jgi:DNA-binding transcriptional LysR family regulator